MRRKWSSILLFFIVLLFCLPDKGLAAAYYSGTVTDANTSYPIDSVLVSLKGASSQTFTDDQGEFYLEVPTRIIPAGPDFRESPGPFALSYQTRQVELTWTQGPGQATLYSVTGELIRLGAKTNRFSLILPHPASGMYVLALQIGDESYAMRIMALPGRIIIVCHNGTREAPGPLKKSSAVTDTLIFSKAGYVSREVLADTTMAVALQPAGVPGNQAYNKAGIYPGFFNQTGHDKFLAFEAWLGRTMDFADANLGKNDWGEFGSTSWGLFENPHQFNFKDLTRVTPCLTVPLNTGSMSATNPTAIAQIRQGLISTANGDNDSRNTTLADRLIAAGHGDAIIRLGHEPDITYYPWSFREGNHDVYIQAFRHVHDLLKGKSADFKFNYQGNGPWHTNNPSTGTSMAESGYPGDEYCDIVGFDTYDKRPWSQLLERLNFCRDFAISKGKPFSIPEWGLWTAGTGGNGDNPDYIQNMYDWLNTLPASGPGSLAYHCYFNGISESNLDQYPNAKARYLELFGK